MTEKINDSSNDWKLIQNAITILLSIIATLMLGNWEGFCNVLLK